MDFSEYTPEQQNAIAAKGKVIVSASAGSGKTRIMIERILRLVGLDGVSLLDILAVTFTDAAALQMKERLRTELIEKIQKSTGKERERYYAALNDLSLAAISTVHSFCTRIIKTYFYLLPEEELAPDCRVLTPQEAKGLSERALDNVLEETFRKVMSPQEKKENGQAEDALEGSFCKYAAALQHVLKVHYHAKKEKALRQVIEDMFNAIHSYENGEGYLTAMLDEKFNKFDEAARCLGKDYADEIAVYRKEFLDFEQEYRDNAAVMSIREKIFACMDDLCQRDTPFEMAQYKPDFPKMSGKPKENGPALVAYEKFKDIFGKFRKLFNDEICKVYADEALERKKYAAALEHARALACICLAYSREYTRLKREANAIDFDDMEHFGLALLNKEEVQKEVRTRYPYVFVDEYQDINPLQERIISRVANEEVFLVGDAKQAIYGFRGSSSEYFRNKIVEFGGAYPLTENFRSASGILDAVNAVFRSVIDGYEKEEMKGGRLYAGNEGEIFSHIIEKLPEEEPAERKLYSVLSGKVAEEKDALSEAVVKVIQSEYGKEYFDCDSKTFRKVSYGDIAVLVRTDPTDGKNIVAALVEHGIPVTSPSTVNICDYFEVRLLIDCLKYLDNADADIPLVAVMLSELGGFVDEDLMQVRIACPRARTFREAAEEYALRDDELAQRLQVFFRRMKRLRALAKVRTAAEILNELLASGLEVEIASKEGGKARLNRVRRFVIEAESCGSVHDFLARLKETKKDGTEYVEYAEQGGENAVKLMTMHKSKGLEFPVVILASMEHKLHQTQEKVDVEWSPNFLFSPRYYDMEKKTYSTTVARAATKVERYQKETEEERNLLYVAMTRAKWRLHLMVKKRERAALFERYRVFSDYFGKMFLGEESERDFEKERILQAMDIGMNYPYAASVPLRQKSSATAILKEQAESADSVHTGGAMPELEAVASSTTEEGTAYHKFLEHYSFGADATAELERMKGAELLLPEDAALLQLDQLKRIAAIPCLKALKGKRCEREKRFLLTATPKEAGKGEDEGVQIIYQGAIDLLVEDENGYVIYDYKYSGRDGATLQEKYRPQIELYKDAVAKGKRVERSTIRAKIINIRTGEEIDM